MIMGVSFAVKLIELASVATVTRGPLRCELIAGFTLGNVVARLSEELMIDFDFLTFTRRGYEDLGPDPMAELVGRGASD